MPFVPSDLSNLVLWLEADTIALADNTQIDSWDDASPANNDATQSGAPRPTLKTGIINGLKVARFDGINDFLNLFSFSSQTFTVFAVVKITNLAAYYSVLGGEVGGLNWAVEVTTGKMHLTKLNVAVIGYSTTGIVANTFAIVAVTYASPDAAFYLNGVADGTASSAQTFADSALALGAQVPSVAAGFFPGDIAAAVAYDRVLSGTDIDSVFTYLNSKYQIYAGTPLSVNPSSIAAEGSIPSPAVDLIYEVNPVSIPAGGAVPTPVVTSAPYAINPLTIAAAGSVPAPVISFVVPKGVTITISDGLIQASAGLNKYDIGDAIPLFATFEIPSSGAFDPEIVRCRLQDPNGGQVTYVYGTDPELIRDNEGQYSLITPAELAGVEVYRWEAIDTSDDQRSGAEERQFYIKRSAFGVGAGGFGGGSGGIDGGSA